MTDNPYKNANSFIKAHVGLWSMLGATYKKLNSKVVFIKSYNNKILAVSGFTRSGKAMLMNLISTFENVEKSHFDIFLEQIHYLNKIYILHLIIVLTWIILTTIT